MSVCSYNSNKLIPAPFVSINKNYQVTGDGTKLSSIYQITITGKILADKGSPYKDTGDGQYKFWTNTGYPPDNSVLANERLGALIRKREQIEQLFKTDGYSLEWQSADGSQPMKCNPRILSINFTDGIWFNYIDFTINLEADVIYANGTLLGTDDLSPNVSDASESWSVEASEEPQSNFEPLSYRVTHTVSATGKRFYDENGAVTSAFERARTYVLAKMGYDSLAPSGFVNPPSYFSNVNHLKSQNYDELAGTFSATESWILASGVAKTEYNINVRKDLNSPFTSVSLDGTITGYRTGSHPYTNAQSIFSAESGAAYSRAQSVVSDSLNTVPLTEAVGHNPAAGTISYSYEFDTRPSNRFTKARSETVSINRDMNANPPAIIPVLGRTRGPVLQDLFTRKEYRITLNVEMVRHPKDGGGQFLLVDSPTFATPYSTELTALFNEVKPSVSFNASKEFIESQTDNFDLTTGRYTYNVTWVYEV